MLIRWAARTSAPLSLAAVWLVLVRRLGIHDAFFTIPSGESIGYRLGATLSAVAGHLGVVAAAAVVALGSAWLWRRTAADGVLVGRVQLRFWLAVLLSLALIVITYGCGSLEIRWWLQTSVSRTTIFPQLAACADLALVASALLPAGLGPRKEDSIVPGRRLAFGGGAHPRPVRTRGRAGAPYPG